MPSLRVDWGVGWPWLAHTYGYRSTEFSARNPFLFFIFLLQYYVVPLKYRCALISFRTTSLGMTRPVLFVLPIPQDDLPTEVGIVRLVAPYLICRDEKSVVSCKDSPLKFSRSREKIRRFPASTLVLFIITAP